MSDALWTDDGLTYVADTLTEVAENAGREDATSLDDFADWVHQQRFAALDAYYASDCEDMAAFGEAIGLLNINHKLAAEGVDVKARSTWP